MALEFTDQNFQQEVLDSNVVTMVDFWAEWCGPCKMIGPHVEALATEFEGKAKVGKLNVDHNQEVSMKYGIRSIPTILFFKGGEIVDKQVGAASKQVLQATLEKHLEPVG